MGSIVDLLAACETDADREALEKLLKRDEHTKELLWQNMELNRKFARNRAKTAKYLRREAEDQLRTLELERQAAESRLRTLELKRQIAQLENDDAADDVEPSAKR